MSDPWLIGGIDPGKSGCLVAVDPDGVIVEVARVPLLPPKKKGSTKRDPDFGLMAYQWGVVLRRCRHVFIERVWGAAPEGRKQGGTSMFNFGYIAGVALGLTFGTGHTEHTFVTPQKWKAHFLLINKSKDASRMLAADMWPLEAAQFKRKKDDGVAEAALIAEYGRIALQGSLQ